MDSNTEIFRQKENFPVASLLIPSKARKAILDLYLFARNADEISDNHKLKNKDRKAQLLSIKDSMLMHDLANMPDWVKPFYQSCMNGEINLRHGIALLDAFIQDTEKKKYDNWAETMQYCRMSAATIGRMVLEAADEYQADFKASDKICSVLQLLNHLQDLKSDYLEDGRQYFDYSFFDDYEVLKNQNETDQITIGKKEVLRKLNHMLDESSNLPATIRGFRIRWEVATIINIARALSAKLYKQDILQQRVELSKNEKFRAFIKGFFASIKRNSGDGGNAEKISRKSKSSFLKPMLGLDRKRREAILTFYALCRLIDDAADDAKTVEQGYKNIEFWQHELNKIFSRDPLIYPDHQVSREFIAVKNIYRIQKHDIDEIIKGQLMDLNNEMIKPSYADFNQYCYRVASCVGKVSVRIFGYHSENEHKIAKFAENLGMAFQHINIMRDVRKDAIKGRIYIPLELLKEWGLEDVTPDELGQNFHLYQKDFAGILSLLGKRARGYLEEAFKNLPDEEKDNMKAALKMYKVYSKYLKKMEDRNFYFEEKDIKLSSFDKFLLMMR